MNRMIDDRISQTCSTVELANPIMNGSKNSERLRISPVVTNLKNITTTQPKSINKISKLKSF